jgi:hypothetical protein
MMNQGYALLSSDVLKFYQGTDFSINKKEFFLTWYLSNYETRLSQLFETVFNIHTVSYSRKHLSALQYYLQDNISIVPKTQDEIKHELSKVPEHLKEIVSVSEYRFTDLTLSISFDIGTYFGEYLKREIPELYWDIVIDTESVLFGHLVLKKTGVATQYSLNQVMFVLTKQIYEKRANEDRLPNLFDTWANDFKGIRKDYLSMVNSWKKK